MITKTRSELLHVLTNEEFQLRIQNSILNVLRTHMVINDELFKKLLSHNKNAGFIEPIHSLVYKITPVQITKETTDNIYNLYQNTKRLVKSILIYGLSINDFTKSKRTCFTENVYLESKKYGNVVYSWYGVYRIPKKNDMIITTDFIFMSYPEFSEKLLDSEAAQFFEVECYKVIAGIHIDSLRAFIN